MSDANNRAEVLGVEVDALSLDELLHHIAHAVEHDERLTVSYANVHGVLLARRDPAFRRALQQLDIVFCDGVGVRWGARMLSQPPLDRYTPPDWIERLAGYRLFLLGGKRGVAAQAGARFQQEYGTSVVGDHHGFFDFDSAEHDLLLTQIRNAAPDILLVGMGMPRQEEWALSQRNNHDTPVVICVGALFDYIAKERWRAPRWWTDMGLEWLARLLHEPRRLGRRYLIGNPMFVALIFRERWRRR